MGGICGRTTPAGLTFHVEEAGAAFDDPIDGGEPEAGAVGPVLSGEERLEDVLQDLRVMPEPSSVTVSSR